MAGVHHKAREAPCQGVGDLSPAAPLLEVRPCQAGLEDHRRALNHSQEERAHRKGPDEAVRWGRAGEGR